ncbi:hypothetical protein GLOIN_2v1772386 [Rhizophagus irregularis DAOM 181602=DAOM 197198]|nr:hypothetical protein GLOIN_2v1772386 [Rhizophagus irregularis DAOM 181602=DAOM 197198]
MQDLTGNAINNSNLISQEVQERIKLMYETQDPNIVFDLRKNGGFKGTKFDEFWNEMDAYFNEVKCLKAKHDEEKFLTISDPSMQSRLLQKSHPDAHYCAALFRYTRLFVIKFRNFTCFISADDKHKVPIGEIVETLTGVRNKVTLAFADMELTSCDHDFTKLSITPSISLLCNIPKDISKSFYQGQVYVSYKDSVFQLSSALRHSAEWLKCLHEKYTILLEMLVIYTDGGADHRTTFGSVQLAMICLFLEGNFDFLAAVRTAPYHLWSNPAECIMSIINLGLQGVALKRSDMSSDSEKVFKNLGTMKEIRNAALYNQTLSEEMKIAIKDTQEILQNRTT